jgi:predicted RNase H-like HicB family nuclease
MKTVYPAVFAPAKEGGYAVFIPDFDIDTQGEDLADAICMARDAIGLMGIDMQDEGKELPIPSSFESAAHEADEIVSMVDIDFDAYRRANDRRTVRRNVSLPSWLDVKASEAGLNVSAVLQTALKNQLGV